MTELEKIDILRERAILVMQRPRICLDVADGDIVAALINLEAMQKNRAQFRPSEERAGEILEKIKNWIRRGRTANDPGKKGRRSDRGYPHHGGSRCCAGANCHFFLPERPVFFPVYHRDQAAGWRNHHLYDGKEE